MSAIAKNSKACAKPAAKKTPAPSPTPLSVTPKSAAKKSPVTPKSAAKKSPATPKSAAKKSPATPKSAAKKSPATPKSAAKKSSATPKSAAKKSPAAKKDSVFNFVGAWLKEKSSESTFRRWEEDKETFTKSVKIPSGKAKKDPAKPKRALTPRAAYAKAFWPEAKQLLIDQGNEKPSLGEISTLISTWWNAASDTDKEPYQQQAAEDKERYNAEMADYTPSEEYATGKKGKKARKPKDPNAPKKPLTAFFGYSNTYRAAAKEQLVNEGNEKPSAGEVSKLLGAWWKEASDKEKKPFLQAAAKDKERYAAEKAEYEGTGGEEEAGEEEAGEEEAGEEEAGEEEAGEEEAAEEEDE